MTDLQQMNSFVVIRSRRGGIFKRKFYKRTIEAI